MSEFGKYFRVSPFGAIIYQLTSARTIQAIVVLVLVLATVLLLAANREVPEIVSSALYVILGYYFGDRQSTSPISQNPPPDE